MVPPASRRVKRVPRYSGFCLLIVNFAYGTFTPYGVLSQNTSAINFEWILQSATPKNISLGLGFFPFARRYLGNRCFFLFLPLLRCFSSRRLPSIAYGFSYRYLSFSQAGFPIRISPDRWLFAPPRSFSQLITSFIGFRCQGIHPTLLFA